MQPIRFSALLFAAGLAAFAADAVPPKTDLDLELLTPIDQKASAADQQISFKTARDAKKDNAVIVRKGAPVVARVTQMQKQSSYIRNVKRNYFIVGIKLVSIDMGSGPVPITGTLETILPTASNDYFAPLSRGPDKWGAFQEYRFQFHFPDPTPGESFLGAVQEYLRVPKGLRLVFRTPDEQ
ncbi:MAG: hypothetical protein ACM336_14105 [Acidobacteriota bacterium]